MHTKKWLERAKNMKIGWINYKQYREDTKKFNSITNDTVKCKCGHSILIGTHGKKICSFCGRMVYKDKKEEFRTRLGKLL